MSNNLVIFPSVLKPLPLDMPGDTALHSIAVDRQGNISGLEKSFLVP